MSQPASLSWRTFAVFLLFVGLFPQEAYPAPAPNRDEWGALPIVAGDTDIGLGFGLLGMLTRFERGYSPHRWWGELMLYLTVKDGPTGLELPYHNHRLQLDFPGLADGRLRLLLRLEFLRFSNSGYYGLGNASSFARLWEKYPVGSKAYIEARRRYQYIRTAPYARIFARYRLSHAFSLFGGLSFTYNWIELYPGSQLEEEARQNGRPGLPLLLGLSSHGSLQFNAGVAWDTRDHETVPQKGMFHDLSLRAAPGFWQRLSFAGLNLTTRFFYSFAGPFLTLALRLMVDLLWGNVPFHELSRYGGLSPENGPGGSYGLPGIPLGRYHGKIKLLGNLELRSLWLPFVFFGARFSLGTVLFVSSGRIWADIRPYPQLDGTSLGLKISFGGGLRLLWGENFLLRADLAWSPEAAAATPSFPFGLYMYVGQIF